MQVRLNPEIEKAIRLRSAQSDPFVTIPRLVNALLSEALNSNVRAKLAQLTAKKRKPDPDAAVAAIRAKLPFTVSTTKKSDPVPARHS